MKNEHKTGLEKELRDILETDGSLSNEQVSRVETIETELENIETEERTEYAKKIATDRLGKRSFSIDGRNVSTNAFTDAQVRAYADWALKGDMRAAGDHLEGTDANGGYLVPLDLQNELVKKLNGVAGIRQAVDARQYGFDVEIATVEARPSIVNFTGEGVAYTAAGVTFGQTRSYSHKSTMESYISEELAQDSRPAIIQEILEAHTEAHALFWDGQYAVDGAGSSNGPEKIFNSTQSGLNVTESASVDIIQLDDLVKAYYEGLPAQYRGGNFSWVMHPTVEYALRSDTDGNERFQLMPQALSSYQGLPNGNILGMPVVISTNAPTYAEAQASAAVPAVMLMERSSYRIFDRLPMTTQRDEFSKGSEGKVVFRSKLRSDGRWLSPYKSVGIKLKQS